MWVFPGYNFGYFRFLVDRYAYSNIRFNSWNSSLHGFIYNIYITILDSQILQFPDNFVQRIEELIIGQGVNKLILTGYFIVLIFSFLNLRLKKMDKLSFLTTICCFTAITTSPFADYHLIIFIFLFFFVYDSNNNSNKNVIQLIIISAILLPKFHAIPPEINIHNIVNVICLNFLLFVSFIKYKSDNQH